MNAMEFPIVSDSAQVIYFALLCLLLTQTCFSRLETDFQPLLNCEQNFVDVGNLTDTLTGISVLTCARQCTRTSGCSGFNFCQDTSTCELLGYVFNSNVTECGDLVYQTGCSYYQRKGCFNGASNTFNQDNCACPVGFKGPTCEEHWTDCLEGYSLIGDVANEFVTVRPRPGGPTVVVFCSGHRALIAHRNRLETSFFTNRTWIDYRNGFFKSPQYTIHSNFWIGLEAMHELTLSFNFTLRFDFMMENSNVTGLSIKYKEVLIENEAQNYTLRYSQFEFGGNNYGWAGDGLGGITGNDTSQDQPFCTLDRDCGECATNSNSAWWFNTGCSYVNPLGLLNDFGWPVNGTKVPLKFLQMVLV